MIMLNVVLREFSVVFLYPFYDEIGSIIFLKQDISHVCFSFCKIRWMGSVLRSLFQWRLGFSDGIANTIWFQTLAQLTP